MYNFLLVCLQNILLFIQDQDLHFPVTTKNMDLLFDIRTLFYKYLINYANQPYNQKRFEEHESRINQVRTLNGIYDEGEQFDVNSFQFKPSSKVRSASIINNLL